MIEELLKDGDFGFLFINMSEERFTSCFSKFEMVSGLETISRVVEERQIPCFACETENAVAKGAVALPRDTGRASDIPVNSVYDEKFRGQFNELVGIVPDPVKAEFYDIFSTGSISGAIRNAGISKVLICGFDSEREILASVIGAVREGFVPVVMSDCVSSVSERVFFEVMNVLSRWAVIGDTRDLVKMWNLW